MSFVDQWKSGARDVFGYRFRDAWSVVGWEEDKVADRYVCWLESAQEPTQTPKPSTPQLDLFA
jgi:hypothetical protein